MHDRVKSPEYTWKKEVEGMKRPKKLKKKKKRTEGGSEEGKEVTKYSPQMVVGGEHTEARKQRFEIAIGKSCYLII